MDIPDYRYLAQQAVTRAKGLLAGDDPHGTRYAALELRDAMEALTYERANKFKEFMPPEKFKIWQARALMKAMIEIDPKVGFSSALSFGLETEFGKPAPPENMSFLGAETVLSFADLKEHYDALGSFLHMPTIPQMEAGKNHDPAKIRERCKVIVGVLEKVLASPIFNVMFHETATLDHCVNAACGKPIEKIMPPGDEAVQARCFSCDMEYTIKSVGPQKVEWKPVEQALYCSNQTCDAKTYIKEHEVKPGAHWKCKACGTHNYIYMKIGPVGLPAADTSG